MLPQPVPQAAAHPSGNAEAPINDSGTDSDNDTGNHTESDTESNADDAHPSGKASASECAPLLPLPQVVSRHSIA